MLASGASLPQRSQAGQTVLELAGVDAFYGKAQILFDKSSVTSSCTPVHLLEVSLGPRA